MTYIKQRIYSRNKYYLSVIKAIEHNYGFLNCGLCNLKQKIIMLGIGNNIIEFNYE